jgi:predicted  nucleic acid-binding Zn-ribbon protein
MATKAKTIPTPTEVKLTITKEQLNIIQQIREALDSATEDIRDLCENGDQEQMTIGFTLGKLHKSLIDAYSQADNLYDELDTDTNDEYDMQF